MLREGPKSMAEYRLGYKFTEQPRGSTPVISNTTGSIQTIDYIYMYICKRPSKDPEVRPRCENAANL